MLGKKLEVEVEVEVPSLPAVLCLRGRDEALVSRHWRGRMLPCMQAVQASSPPVQP